ncbi:MAG: sulfatase, partial [Opitutae bacterium]|nr:sulfatase [Opitutae bacterium]
KAGRFAGRTVSGKFIHGTDLHSLERQYNQGVLAIDEGVGKLIKALKETGQYDNTLIVFGADQGIAWGQKGFQMKLAPYDGTIRGPLIVSMPKKFPSGKVCPKPVGGADLVPTFFKTAGLEHPWKMHGRDLTPLLEKPERKDWKSPLLLAHTGMSFGEDCDEVIDMKDDPIYQKQRVPWWVSLRTDRYKYIRNLLPGETEELYDMKKDPNEMINLAFEGNHSDLLRKLRKKTVSELERTDCAFARKMPEVRNR